MNKERYEKNKAWWKKIEEKGIKRYLIRAFCLNIAIVCITSVIMSLATGRWDVINMPFLAGVLAIFSLMEIWQWSYLKRVYSDK